MRYQAHDRVAFITVYILLHFSNTSDKNVLSDTWTYLVT